jgi:hypothetical protein
MRFYNHSHAFYAGVDLHARSMFTHILDHDGKTVFEADLPAGPDAFRNARHRQNLEPGAALRDRPDRAFPRSRQLPLLLATVTSLPGSAW